jgi:hypothetical protein
MNGTPRARVGFFCDRLTKLGFVDYSGGREGGVQVHNSLLSVVLHDQLLEITSMGWAARPTTLNMLRFRSQTPLTEQVKGATVNIDQ